MTGIRIRLIGNVAFENTMKLSDGYRYDIPVDLAGIPFIPLSELLPEELMALSDIYVGFAHPEGYMSYQKAADRMMKIEPAITPLIRACFTGEMYGPEGEYRIRYLKAGQVFYANVSADTDRKELERLLRTVTRLGIQAKGISGEVELTLCEPKQHNTGVRLPDWRSPADRLEYTIMFLTPVCFHAPYAEGVRTITYVPGGDLRDSLMEASGGSLSEVLRDMTFSNAYLSDGQNRLLPLPLCMSLVKLDKTQLRYRLAPGRDYNRVEQDMDLEDAYAKSFDRLFTAYSKPETERIVSRRSGMYDALIQGQMFRGTIYGNDAELRALYKYLRENPYMYLGQLKQEGYGEVCIKPECLLEKEIGRQSFASAFDVSCLSHTLFLNEEGMADTGTGVFLKEIERILHAAGQLKATGKYVDVYKDIGKVKGAGREGAQARCFAKGSVFRLETKDGRPLDISPILHTFVGERTRDGYGEILAYPAQDCYYRTAARVPTKKFDMGVRSDWRSIYQEAYLTRQVILLLLRRNIKSLAAADRMDPEQRTGAQCKAPIELLRIMREKFDPAISDEQLISWYQEGLMEDEDGFISER